MLSTGPFSVVVILIKEDSEECQRARRELSAQLERNKIQVSFEIPRGPNFDLVICMGGDGTLLSYMRKLGELRHHAPVLGIHGSRGLGFLYTLGLPTRNSSQAVSDSDWGAWAERIVQSLLLGDYELEAYWGLELYTLANPELRHWALNELVIGKGELSRMISLALKVEGSPLWDEFRGDGLIVSSALGSTAYCLSAGGPIVHPSVEAFILTPICPNEISQRPLVLSSKMKLEIQLLKGSAEAFLTEDGQTGIKLEAETRMQVERAQKALSWVHLRIEAPSESSYLGRLRNKLGLGGRKKYAT